MSSDAGSRANPPAAAETSGDPRGALEDASTVGADISAPPVAFTYAEQEAFELLAPYLQRNPRHVKRLVNVYRLVRSLAHRAGEREVTVQVWVCGWEDSGDLQGMLCVWWMQSVLRDGPAMRISPGWSLS